MKEEFDVNLMEEIELLLLRSSKPTPINI